ncbi:2-succinyl-6-hydroxy-2,4-cyclohexadiene-1-carboxylate synthase [bacterium (Candidatus Blackallbacteria) CG17_big_fil_post_rev_8_21_14_2_50_48_46]|uniref:2-succinyl-6-hydroxy-2, 4-cyclohexadiene-1-carboxylate synthase n=1 Tax=bacterium (Candidatus Blackallbacteria) CG17_big_fil_post_rev_8_21_14_2_50_48_46 TaxID=2014261 RepID=A0A2M7FZQ8_9BACT|nr:MAG: 2-succinyl-6-hydroxy-2,4-cyclohexadiene-1-carboxylate synthase [bacterium (Candidatus Blackallbacteria) CG18_big_fil_WC_8_21_14_2_50_49_26]PIW14839.1 MAG: 2-succinyl-6-hydroxy-2,4-cyclohexadiene-1-carboxylate synthase [bacterium (Candidatus Blackallbacteria) CG17_big_fil_post_rev_8_21_14_2_50_48_46]PIW44406.1 MAG: 2-succinyl-6-hydroxy-2,4-cyclohexadiene-1-carboxylate synthase [bacterium (Candidatus Blackallbacteria) CG13_big_fil_rev_8_21_14_2_50_49_14]
MFRKSSAPHLEKGLFLHGFLGSGQDWQALLSELAFPILAWTPDLPGHGPNTQSVPDFETCLSQLGSQWLRAQTEPLHLLGYSMGGRLALGLALRYPEKVKSLCLISASAGLADENLRLQRQSWEAEWAHTFRSQPLLASIEAWYAQPLFHPFRSSSGYNQACQERLRNNPEGLAQAMVKLGAGQQKSYWNRLAELKMPLLFLVGSKDPAYLEIGRRICQQVERAELEILNGYGHSLILEAPRELAKKISLFLKAAS